MAFLGDMLVPWRVHHLIDGWPEIIFEKTRFLLNTITKDVNVL